MRPLPARLIPALLAIFSSYVLLIDFKRRDKGVALVLDAQEARSLCGAAGYDESQFWERARIIGAAGVLLRADQIGRMVRRGEAVHFTRPEVEKLRAAGLGRLKPNSLLVRDPKAAERVLEALRRRGIPAAGRVHGEMRLVELPEGFSPEEMPVGFPPAAASRAAAAGLTPVFLLEAGAWPQAELLERGPAAWLIAPGFTGLGPWRSALEAGRVWLAFANAERGGPFHGSLGRVGRADRARELSEAGAALNRVLLAGETSVREGAPGAWREALGRGNRMLVVRLDLSADVERNLAGLRALSRAVRRAGYHQDLPLDLRDVRSLPKAERWVRYLLALALAVLGPIFALRQGLSALRFLHKRRPWPLASPILEVAGGTLAATALAVAVGLAVYSLLSVEEWRLGLFPFPWAGWVVALPCAAALGALYALDAPSLKAFLRHPEAVGLGRFLAAAAAATVLLVPMRTIGSWEPGGWVSRALELAPSSWWLALRWREVLVGMPCLFVGLALYLRRLEEPARKDDPRPWLLLALLCPIGLIELFARTYAPFEAVLAQTAPGLLLGGTLGVLLLLLRDRMVERFAR